MYSAATPGPPLVVGLGSAGEVAWAFWMDDTKVVTVQWW